MSNKKVASLDPTESSEMDCIESEDTNSRDPLASGKVDFNRRKDESKMASFFSRIYQTTVSSVEELEN